MAIAPEKPLKVTGLDVINVDTAAPETGAMLNADGDAEDTEDGNVVAETIAVKALVSPVLSSTA
jgi:hypothetical protein